MSIYTVYKHTSPSGKSYIGQTCNVTKREQHHKLPTNKCRAFAAAIKKYGWDNFLHEELANGLTLDDANSLETKFINEFGTLVPYGYNLTRGGDNKTVSEETRQKIIASKQHISDSTKLKMSIAHLGIRLSEQTRQKISENNARRGKPLSDNHRQKISQAQKGKQLTKEHISKLKKPKATVVCPHCGKIGAAGVMKRWHFSNCVIIGAGNH